MFDRSAAFGFVVSLSPKIGATITVVLLPSKKVNYNQYRYDYPEERKVRKKHVSNVSLVWERSESIVSYQSF
jgi:hypothetical protein